MNNLFFAQLKKELFVAITERESVTGKCETLNNLLCEKIAAELSEKYYDLKIYHSEFGLCRSFWNAKYEWIEQENSIMLYLTTQPLYLDPANFRKEEEAIIDAYNKSSKMPNIPLLKILEKKHASRKLKGVWSWELPIEKIEDIIQEDLLNLEIIKSPWRFEL